VGYTTFVHVIDSVQQLQTHISYLIETQLSDTLQLSFPAIPARTCVCARECVIRFRGLDRRNQCTLGGEKGKTTIQGESRAHSETYSDSP
jgi:hypothetical protein